MFERLKVCYIEGGQRRKEQIPKQIPTMIRYIKAIADHTGYDDDRYIHAIMWESQLDLVDRSRKVTYVKNTTELTA